MKNSRVKLIEAGLALVFILSFLAVATGQTGSCDFRDGGVYSARFGPIDEWKDDFCLTTPIDLVNGIATCRDCLPAIPRYPYPQFSNGGSATVTNYSKEMVIEFSEPVASRI